MRIIFFAATVATVALAPLGSTLAAAPGNPPVCTPSGPPQGPSSEDYNPGFGRVTGLNDDFHDDLEDPTDVPGQFISDLTHSAQGEGALPLLSPYVGNDCRNVETGE